MTSAFITGGSGLVGSHLIYELLQKGYRIRALKRPQSNLQQVAHTFSLHNERAEELFRQIEWVDGDLLNFNDIREALDGCEEVYHTAAIVSFDQSDKHSMLKTNVNGTANMVNACLEKQIPLCFVSSIGALGRGTLEEPVTENDWWQTDKGRSVYAYSKYKAEMEVWRGIAEGLQAIIVNPAVILGAGDWEKGSLKFFPQVHKGMRFYTHGVTAFVDVRDVTQCMTLLMQQQLFGERYILSAGELSYRELFDMIANGLCVTKPSIEIKPWMLGIAYRLSELFSKLSFRKPTITKETARSAFEKHCYSTNKIKDALSYEFIPLEQTIRDSCRWFLLNR